MGSKMTVEQLHAFWRNPDPDNSPEEYMEGIDRTALLTEYVQDYIAPGGQVLELGCNVGRNLYSLRKDYDVIGVEINASAAAIASQSGINVLCAPVEDVIRDFASDSVACIITMAFLEHVHPLSEWVFAEMVRISRRIIVVEDEVGKSPRHFPRQYGDVFRALGMVEVDHFNCDKVPGLGPGFWLRVLVR